MLPVNLQVHTVSVEPKDIVIVHCNKYVVYVTALNVTPLWQPSKCLFSAVV